MFHVKHAADLSQLVENIREHGVIFPVYYFEGRVLDGNRRALASLEAGRPFKMVVLEDREAAARVLWSFHPDRALQQFASDLPLSEAARLLGASPSAIVKLRRKPKPRRKYAPRVGVELRARLKENARRAWRALCEDHHCTVSEAIAALVWVVQEEKARDLFSYHLRKGRENQAGSMSEANHKMRVES